MQWIRVDQTGRRLIIRPIIACHGEPVEKEVDGRVDPADGPAPDEALLQALAGIGSRIRSAASLPAVRSTLSGCTPGICGPGIPTARP